MSTSSLNPSPVVEYKSEPLPDCAHCHSIVQDGLTRWAGRNENASRSGNVMGAGDWQWSASRLFHDPCASCDARGEPSPLLCQFCQHLRFRHLSLCVPVEHLPKNVPFPKPGPDATCPLCLLFLRLSRREHTPQKRPYPIKFPLYISATEWRQQREQVQWLVGGADRWGTPAEFLVVQDDAEPLPVLDAILSDMTALKDSISRCERDHDFCKSSEDTDLPSDFRLVDVDKQRIVSPPAENRPRYVALSYVWGTTDATDLTTKSNIAERLENLELITLPATIRDVATACERLGERYVWIDRLCIVQDDDADKAQQIRAMCAIYSAAKFVLVHASGVGISDGIAGISRERKPQISQELCNLKINVQLPALWDIVGPSTWNSRGWTYQEAILPKRKVFFTDSQIFFECAARINHEETLAYSSFDRSMHDKKRYPSTTTSLSYGAAESSANNIKFTRLRYRTTETPWEAYTRHVPRYCQRRLQSASDLVNAFSGVLGALYSGPDSTFNGLPLEDMDTALLWRNLKSEYVSVAKPVGRPLVRRTEPSDFPSWSWASITTGVAPSYDDVGRDFCGSLCLWFRRASTQGCVEPVVAAGNAASAWVVRDDGNTFVIYARYAGIVDARYVMARAIMAGMIESPVTEDAASWDNMRADEVEDELRRRWPSYPAFWQDVHGRVEALQVAPEHLEKNLSADMQRGLLYTRAQVLSVRIMEVQETSTWGRIERSSKAVRLFSTKDVKIGALVHDHNGQVSESLRNGNGDFECMAISLSAMRHVDDKDLTDQDIKECFVGEPAKLTRYRLECWVNALVIRRRDRFCYRVGLAQIAFKHWLGENPSFETVTLT